VRHRQRRKLHGSRFDLVERSLLATVAAPSGAEAEDEMVGAVRFEPSSLVSRDFAKSAFRPRKYWDFLTFGRRSGLRYLRTKMKKLC
jgi:hypothetical protein